MPNYWIFKSNPILYRIDDRLMDPEPNTTWQVNRFRKDIHRGDIAFIWRAGPPQRGICALMEIDSEPEFCDEITDEKKYYLDLDEAPTWRVRGRFIRRFPIIPKRLLEHTTGLEKLSVLRWYAAATNFPATPAEGEIILKLITEH